MFKKITYKKEFPTQHNVENRMYTTRRGSFFWRCSTSDKKTSGDIIPNAVTCVSIRDIGIVITDGWDASTKCASGELFSMPCWSRWESFSRRVSFDVCSDAVNNVGLSFLDVFSLLPTLVYVESPLVSCSLSLKYFIITTQTIYGSMSRTPLFLLTCIIHHML